MNQPLFASPTTEHGISVELLNALKNGDQRAYEKLFIRYYNKLIRFIDALIRSTPEAEDLTQEIFAQIWFKREQIDPSRNFNSYLYTLARNSVLNHLRSKKVRNRYAANFAGEEAGGASDEIVIARETELLINIVVSRMPPQRRRVYELSRQEGLSNGEVAAQLNITKNAVEKQLRFALKEIKEVLSVFLLFLLH